MFLRDDEKKIKVDNSLEKIYLPKNKLDMFVNWFNDDLMYQTEIPMAFKEGYLYVENDFFEFHEDKNKELIRNLARKFNASYNAIKNSICQLEESLRNIVIYFNFLEDNKINLKSYTNSKEFSNAIYEIDGKQIVNSKIIRNITLENIANIDVTNLIEDKEVDLGDVKEFETINKLQAIMAFNTNCIFVAVMWYLATSTNVNKYKYEINRYNNENEKKEIRSVSKKRTITTPIYDFKKINVIKVDRLIQRRKGWTYSHSFEVSGHYRHYQSGRVVFIKPFIKGKNKPKISREVTLNPKEGG